jgi:3-hydroxyisobutyrate dehydrogenase-like beta-hydroxyacid dehydrogenase
MRHQPDLPVRGVGVTPDAQLLQEQDVADIAFLGTGLLGAAFAEAAAKRGDAVSAWNRSPDKVLALAPFGVKAAATPAEAVRGASRVHLVLKEDAVVDAVIAAARPGLSADAVVVDHSTTLPTLTAERAARLRAQGIRYLHCPVFMGPPAARNAQGFMLAAGPQAVFEAVRADLSRMTGRLEYMGERSDLAAADKLLGNAMLIGIWAVMADVLTLAKACNVDAADAIRLLGALDVNAAIARRGPGMAKGDFSPSFELAMARKDVRLMLEMSGDRPLAALPAVAARMDALMAAGHGARDASVMAIDALR